MKIIYGTSNQAKIAQVKDYLDYKNIDVEILSLKDIGFNEEIDENGTTFEENSLIKAKAIKAYCEKNDINEIIMTDDAGLCIDALNGEPGVYSARYAGDHAPQIVAINKVLSKMENVKDEDRTAKFVCVLTLMNIPDISLIRTISPLMRTASRSVRWAYVCIKTDMRLLSTGRNTVVQNQIGHVAASVSIPVHLQNTEEPYTFLQQIIQDYLTYRQETVKHGKRNMMEVLP